VKEVEKTIMNDAKPGNTSIIPATEGNKLYPWILVGLLWGVALLNYMDR
jgi:hypothetical protein